MQESKTSYHKKPAHLSTDAWQRALRHEFARDEKQPFAIMRTDGEHPVFADYSVENPATKGRYKVALRSRDREGNFCSCTDFKTNALGTCKHIEAVLHMISRDEKLAPLLAQKYILAHTALYLRYGEAREVVIQIGTHEKERYKEFARKYFDAERHLLPESYERIDEILEEGRRIEGDFRCYDDALAFIAAARQHRERRTIVDRISRDRNYFDQILKVPLYPFQREGVLFAARAGRCLIADEMGLGKTIQSIAAAELLKHEQGARRTLIVCPTSLKYQWKHEIEKFAGHEATVIEGTPSRRHRQYCSDAAYTIAHYNIIGADLSAISAAHFDTVILDEAQRIKNWNTKLARDVKRIATGYAIVLTGTPIENKLEELYSILSFIDPYKLGPVYRFLETHQIKDENGKVTGYRELNKIQNVLADIVIRRRKKDVLKELPERTDKHVFVAMTTMQTEGHQEYAERVSRLVNKWKNLGFLDEKDRQRLMIALNCMRMLADSTYILDEVSRHDTKIDELMHRLDDVLEAGEEKMVIFSQWERMTRLVQGELEKRGIRFVSLHGKVPSKKREGLLSTFRDDASCRVFLSTDAGGVGLNLQTASIVVNMDLPWNPAVLEQRIGRVYRHGQGRRVSVVNLISRGSIEERMLDVLKFKSSLFAGIFDGGENEVHMGESTFKRFMRDVEGIANPSEKVRSVSDIEGAQREQKQTDELPAEVISTPVAEERPLRAPAEKEMKDSARGMSVKPESNGLIATAFRMFGTLLRRWF